MATMTRRDVHRPAVMDPAAYTWIGCEDAATDPREYSFEFDWQSFAELTGAGEEVAQRDYREAEGIPWASVEHAGGRGGCDHCGQRRIRYWSFYLHVPTGEVVAVGRNCAEKLALDSREDIARREAVQRRRMADVLAKWRAADERNDRAYDELLRQEDEAAGSGGYANEFVDSLLKYARRNGFLSEAQRDAVLKGIETRARKAQEREERDAEMGDPKPAAVVEGRIEIIGRVAAMKWQDSDYGGAMKILVIDDRGFRVWGTAPEAIIRGIEQRWQAEIAAGSWGTRWSTAGAAADGSTGAFVRERKIRARFTATVERSRKDEAFGFYKRPTKAQVIA